MVRLDTQRVWIDADHFEHLAESALRQRDVAGYENALAAYGGEFLPEDRYEDWCTERREYLRVLHTQLLLALAESHEERGAHSASAARLRECCSTSQRGRTRIADSWPCMPHWEHATRPCASSTSARPR